MKKIKLISLIFVLILLFTACNTLTNSVDATPEPKYIEETMIEIESGNVDGIHYRIIADKETKVMYIFTKAGYGGGLTAMLNSDGTPKLYE